MSAIDNFAQDVAAELNRGHPNGPNEFDPTILIAIITAIFQWLADCKKPAAQAAEVCKNPNLLQRVRLDMLVRRHAKRHQLEEVKAALQDAGKKLTAARAKAMLAEVA